MIMKAVGTFIGPCSSSNERGGNIRVGQLPSFLIFQRQLGDHGVKEMAGLDGFML